jgi:hypothetical protein
MAPSGSEPCPVSDPEATARRTFRHRAAPPTTVLLTAALIMANLRDA